MEMNDMTETEKMLSYYGRKNGLRRKRFELSHNQDMVIKAMPVDDEAGPTEIAVKVGLPMEKTRHVMQELIGYGLIEWFSISATCKRGKYILTDLGREIRG